MSNLFKSLQALLLLVVLSLGVFTYAHTASANPPSHVVLPSQAAGQASPSPSTSFESSTSPSPSTPGQATCPNSEPWVKIDGLSGLSYHYTAPEGELITKICYKAGTEVVYEDVVPPVFEITINSNVFNPQGNNYQELSHASFELAIDPGPSSSPSPSVSPSPSPSMDPSPSPSVSPSPTPTPTPSNNTTSSSSSSSDSGSVQGDSTPEIGGEVLGAYAATGVVQDVIMNVLGSVGGLMTMAGSVLYGKKSKKLAL